VAGNGAAGSTCAWISIHGHSKVEPLTAGGVRTAVAVGPAAPALAEGVGVGGGWALPLAREAARVGSDGQA